VPPTQSTRVWEAGRRVCGSLCCVGDAYVALLPSFSELKTSVPSHIGLVVSDIRMPGATDGLELAAWLRRERPKIKIVLLSGYTATREWQALQTWRLESPWTLRSSCVRLGDCSGTNFDEIPEAVGKHLLILPTFATQLGKQVGFKAAGPRSAAKRSSSSSGIYVVIKTKKNVVAAAVTISSTIRGSRRGFMLPKRTGAERVAIMVVDIPARHSDAPCRRWRRHQRGRETEPAYTALSER
jgi:CheY-like chemotaxis protein